MLLVVWRRDSLEDLQSLHSSSSSSGLMRDHAADGLVEDTGRCAEVEGTASCRVVSGHLAEIGMVLDCVEE